MYNNNIEEDRSCCDLSKNTTSSPINWGQFRKSLLFPPLENCQSETTVQANIDVVPLVADSSVGKTFSIDPIALSQEYYLQHIYLPEEEKENSILNSSISLSEKHKLHFPVDNNRQFVSNKKLKSCNNNNYNNTSSKNILQHHNNMKFRNLLSNISKAVGGNTTSSTSSDSAPSTPSQQKGKEHYNFYLPNINKGIGNLLSFSNFLSRWF